MARAAIDWGAIRVWALTAALIVGGIAAAVWALDLVPPDRPIRFAAGARTGAYHAVAERYRAILARDGLTVEVVETAGSGENAALISDGAVDVALLQGGIDPAEGAEVHALGAVFLEPLLIFTSAQDPAAADPRNWPGRRIAVGPPGSGTRAVVERAIGEFALDVPERALRPIGGQAAADALLAGEIDAAVFVAPIDAPYLRPLIASRTVIPAPIPDVEAIERRLAFVRVVEIPEAGFDFSLDRPAESVRLPAMVARLVSRRTLHPAIENRLVMAAREIHQGADLVTREGEFPNVRRLGMEVDAQARSLIEDGPPPFEDLLPYWLSAQINRVAVLLVPLVVLLLPLLRALPGLYDWRMRARIWRNYDDLMEIDRSATDADPATLDALEARLDAIEDHARRVSVPLSRRGEAYALRLHVDHVRRSLAERRRALSG